MQIISWNIGWGCKKEKIAQMLKLKLEHYDSIACLQEVMPSVKSYICSYLGDSYYYIYSLDSRYVGKFDTKSRKLGVLIILSKTFKFLYSRTLNRTPFPDRTLLVSFAYMGVEYKVMNIHSVTGHNYSKAKSVQFYSFAEAINNYRPDFVAFDANEPDEDHFNEEERVYFDNKDKGLGAKTFFNTLKDSGLQDAYAALFNKESYKKGEPLAVSHIVNKKVPKRYDFIYIRRDLDIFRCEYLYKESIEASADHAMVAAKCIGNMQYRDKNPDIDFDALPFEGNLSTEELLSHCLYYKGGEIDNSSKDHDTSKIEFYEKCWVDFVQHDRGYIAEMVQEYIFAGLELFNCDDGVPISLKALLFNRYQHWVGWAGWLNDVNGFKKFYLENYKPKK